MQTIQTPITPKPPTYLFRSINVKERRDTKQTDCASLSATNRRTSRISQGHRSNPASPLPVVPNRLRFSEAVTRTNNKYPQEENALCPAFSLHVCHKPNVYWSFEGWCQTRGHRLRATCVQNSRTGAESLPHLAWISSCCIDSPQNVARPRSSFSRSSVVPARLAATI